jgi:hypothetical protein
MVEVLDELGGDDHVERPCQRLGYRLPSVEVHAVPGHVR